MIYKETLQELPTQTQCVVLPQWVWSKTGIPQPHLLAVFLHMKWGISSAWNMIPVRTLSAVSMLYNFEGGHFYTQVSVVVQIPHNYV